MVVLGAAAVALTMLVVLLWPGGSDSTSQGFARDPPDSPDPALDVPDPEPLAREAHVSVWTIVRTPATARSAPDDSARAITNVGRSTPEGTDNPLLVLGRRTDASGKVWVRVRLAVLPNGTTGWVPRSALGGYRTVRTRLVVDLAELHVTLLRDGRQVLRAPIGVGEPQWPTPRGEFYVRNKLVSYRSDFYGPLAFGTSARSAVLTDWPDGGFVGIHGTSQPDQIPGRISHGCIRMRNPDIVRLSRLMPVGTPIRIA